MSDKKKRKPLVPRESVPKKDSLPAHIYRVVFTDSSGKKKEYRFYVRNPVCGDKCTKNKKVSMEASAFVSALMAAMKEGDLNFEFGNEDNYGRIFEHYPEVNTKDGDSIEIGRIHSLSCGEVLKELLKAVNIEVIYKGERDILRHRLDSPDVIRKKRKGKVTA